MLTATGSDSYAGYHWVPAASQLEMLTGRYVRHVFASHAHESWTICVVPQGAVNVNVHGQPTALAADGVLVLPPGTVHGSTGATTDAWEELSAYPTEAQIRATLGATAKLPRICGVLRDPRLAAATAERLRRLREATSVGQAEAVFASLVRDIWQTRNAPVMGPLTSGDECIAPALSYIGERVGQRLPLAAMAEACGMSRFHFIRRFQAELRMTPYAYSLQLRVQRAKSLIDAGTDLSVVATATGFVDLSHLNRHFKRVIGLTAGAYRGELVVHRRSARLG